MNKTIDFFLHMFFIKNDFKGTPWEINIALARALFWVGIVFGSIGIIMILSLTK